MHLLVWKRLLVRVHYWIPPNCKHSKVTGRKEVDHESASAGSQLGLHLNKKKFLHSEEKKPLTERTQGTEWKKFVSCSSEKSLLCRTILKRTSPKFKDSTQKWASEMNRCFADKEMANDYMEKVLKITSHLRKESPKNDWVPSHSIINYYYQEINL